nr:AraC family transcriptional regulator [Pedobacter panaciterrae]
MDKNLDTNLSLETISKVACFSPFHFHRIFKAITNETLNSYINRKRIEKVASVLMHKPEVNITVLVHLNSANRKTADLPRLVKLKARMDKSV